MRVRAATCFAWNHPIWSRRRSLPRWPPKRTCHPNNSKVASGISSRVSEPAASRPGDRSGSPYLLRREYSPLTRITFSRTFLSLQLGAIPCGTVFLPILSWQFTSVMWPMSWSDNLPFGWVYCYVVDGREIYGSGRRMFWPSPLSRWKPSWIGGVHSRFGKTNCERRRVSRWERDRLWVACFTI
jgi:hypothetical protein